MKVSELITRLSELPVQLQNADVLYWDQDFEEKGCFLEVDEINVTEDWKAILLSYLEPEDWLSLEWYWKIIISEQ